MWHTLGKAKGFNVHEKATLKLHSTHLVFSFISRFFGVQITSLRVLLGAVASENQMSITTDS